MVQGTVEGGQCWPEGLFIKEGTPLDADACAAAVLIQGCHVPCLLHVAGVGTSVWQEGPRQSLPPRQLLPSGVDSPGSPTISPTSHGPAPSSQPIMVPTVSFTMASTSIL